MIFVCILMTLEVRMFAVDEMPTGSQNIISKGSSDTWLRQKDSHFVWVGDEPCGGLEDGH